MMERIKLAEAFLASVLASQVTRDKVSTTGDRALASDGQIQGEGSQFTSLLGRCALLHYSESPWRSSLQPALQAPPMIF